MRKSVAHTACALLVAMSSAPVLAVDLEPIRVQSRVGEPLRAEIAVTDAAGVAAMVARQPGAAAYARSGVSRGSRVLDDLRFAVVEGQAGQWTIRITSAQPVQEDFLTFLVELDWGDDRIVREFSVALPGDVGPASRTARGMAEGRAEPGVDATGLIERPVAAPAEIVETVEPPEAQDVVDPAAVVFDSTPADPVATDAIALVDPATPAQVPELPADAEGPAAATEAAPVPPVPLASSSRPPATRAPQPPIQEAVTAAIPLVTPARRTQAVPQAARASATPPASRPAASPSPVPVQPPGVAAGTVGPVASGSTLTAIAARVVSADVPTEAALVGLLLANPDAFADGNINRLRQGATLRVPSPVALAAIDPARAREVVALQETLWETPDNAAAREALQTALAAIQATPAAPAAAQAAARPVAPPRLEILPETPPPSDTPLTAAGAGGSAANAPDGEAAAARALEVQHLERRVTQLERLNEEQRALIAMQNAAISKAQRYMEPGSAAGVWNLGIGWLWLGLAAALGVSGVWFAMRRKRRRTRPLLPAHSPATDEAGQRARE